MAAVLNKLSVVPKWNQHGVAIILNQYDYKLLPAAINQYAVAAAMNQYAVVAAMNQFAVNQARRQDFLPEGAKIVDYTYYPIYICNELYVFSSLTHAVWPPRGAMVRWPIM